MAAANRTSRLSAMFDVLKKHYRPVPSADPQRPILEHLLFACCLENTRYEIAEEAFGTLLVAFFDYNEMRVSSIRELSEVMAVLPDSRSAAFRIKRCLQDVFEAEYSFDLEDCRKGNLGPTVERLRKINGTSPFSIAYVVQTALEGHSLPVDSSTLGALAVLDLVNEKNIEEGIVPGLERAVSKSNGPAYGSLLHQFGADFFANPYDPKLHKIFLEIDPDCEPRLPTRSLKMGKPEESPKQGADARQSDQRKRQKQKKADVQTPMETACESDAAEGADKTSRRGQKKAPVAKTGGKDVPRKKEKEKKAVPATRKKKSAPTTKNEGEEQEEKTKKRASSQLAKRKPR